MVDTRHNAHNCPILNGDVISLDIVTWSPFIIALIAGLVKLILQGKEYKTNFIFVLLTIIIGAGLGIVFGFIDAFLASTTFTIDQTLLIGYLFEAFIGSIIIPIVVWLTSIKLE